MQERELRNGSPSTTGANPVASLGVPPTTALDCKPVRGSNTGVGVSVGVDGLSASLPPVAFAGGVPPEANAVRAQRRRAGGR
eukprot:2684913-Pleurochrysis_carterae.AAC.1